MRLDSSNAIRILLMLFSGCALIGQTQSGISGRVSDPSGAVVVGAVVIVQNTDTGRNYEVRTNEAGIYSFPILPPGPYSLQCAAPGFEKMSRTGLRLETGQAATIDFHLQIGSAAETISVNAATPLLETEDATQGQFIERQTVVNMPVESRRAESLIRLMGNVAFKSESGINQAPSFSLAGGRSSDQMWFLDGSSVQDIALGAPGSMMNPPAESIQEFRVEANGYPAEFGRASGGVIHMTTRSGTNAFHGAAYEFVRNDAFDARTFFAASKAPLRYNIYGVSAGGPVIRNRTFFFANWEEARRRDGLTFANNTVPTAAEAAGDFSARKDITIKDPLTGAAFPGNLIPGSRIDPVGRAMVANYPKPNVGYDASKADANNFAVNVSDPLKQDNAVMKVDHRFSDSDNVYARYLYGYTSQTSSPVLPAEFADFRANIHGDSQHYGTLNWVHIFRPSLINEARAGLVNRDSTTVSSAIHSNMNQKLGILGVDPTAYPLITATSYTNQGMTKQFRDRGPSATFQPMDSVSWIHGKHQVKFGGEWRFSLNVDRYGQQPGGEFDFNDRATGNAIASMLLGWVAGGSVVSAPKLVGRTDYYGLFVQDTWKATPRLTLTIGLRWDMDSPRWDRNNQQSGFDPNKINPVSGTPGVVTFAGVDGVSKYANNFDKNNFGPRFGFAYRAGGKWAVRGAYGIFYDGQYAISATRILTLGFGVNGSFGSSSATTRAFQLSEGMPTPGPQLPTAAFGAVKVGQSPNTSPEFVEPNHATGYLQHWNFTIQRQLPGSMVAEAAYIASAGHHLAGPTINVNMIPLTDGHGPASQLQTLRPFPQFNNVTQDSPSWGNSTYNSLNLKLEKRYSNGLNLMANYTWAKFLDDVSGGDDIGGNSSNYQHLQLRKLDKSYSGSDIPHRFVMAGVYELPFGIGRRWSNRSRLADAAIGGWGLGANILFQSGSPWGVVQQTNTANTFAASQRPILLRDPALDGWASKNDMLNGYFDVTAFDNPAAGYFGNAARNVGRGPGMSQVDVSLHKRWRLTERAGLIFRADAFNLFNRAQFANPNTSHPTTCKAGACGTFGTIRAVSAGTAGRLLEFSMKLEF